MSDQPVFTVAERCPRCKGIGFIGKAVDTEGNPIPKPTTGEKFLWDEKYVDYRLGRDASWSQIIEAANYSINAALDAEEKRANDSIEENVRLMNRLAAEREKVAFRDKVIAQQRDALQRFQDQLDAKRERVQTIVDALTDTKSALNNGGYFTPIIDAALAKVKEGK